MSGLEKACRIRQTANGDWVISPPPSVRLYIEADTTIHDNLSYHFRPDTHGRNIVTEQAWISRVSAEDETWIGITWSPELEMFAVVGTTGPGNNQVMTSPDGINWTIRTAVAGAGLWHSIAWSPGLGLFAAVAYGGANRVMTSPDGINWTSRTPAEVREWRSIAWSPELGLFAAVANTGTDDRVMTSPDGINWTARVSAADEDWHSIAWSPELGLFAAVAITGTSNGVMTSPDGINWTIRVPAADLTFRSIAWSPELGLFAVVSDNGSSQQVMTSPDGINWTRRFSPGNLNWFSIAWSPELGLFAAVANNGVGNRVMTSPDGINWTIGVSGADENWYGVAWSPELGLFAAVAPSGTGNRVMTSACGRSRIQQNADDDWQILPPAGQITRVGETVGGFVPPSTNDDLLVSGKCATYGTITSADGFSSVGDSEVSGKLDFTLIGAVNGESESYRARTEEITIAVGTGAAGVISAADLFQPNSIILSVHARVTQAPGGGATTMDIEATGLAADDLIVNMPTTLNLTGNSIVNSDGTHDGPFYNKNTRTLTIKTNFNVTGSDMKVRVCVNYIVLWAFDS
ncbi:hypothetical protein LCGC14_0898800 [marine sediment metagenome]|uniref:Uncharacterized protein n=1 Tax=marine sediment metagenome TaxID=412755 RepID=A0A0F9RG54_9ZZZZ